MKYCKFILGAAMLLSGIFTIRAQSTPGGVNNANYTWMVWLTPDSYNSGTWTNLITTAGTLGNFTALGTAPAKAATGYNFHQPVRFTNQVNRLQAQNANSIVAGDNLTFILVMKREAGSSYSVVLSYNENNYNSQFWYYGSNSGNGPFFSWTNNTYFPTSTSDGLKFVNGIAAVSYANTATNPRMVRYFNGEEGNSGTTEIGTGANSGKLLIASRNAAGADGFTGTIHELIILKAPGANNRINAADLQQINSYLSIKYGIMLNNSDNYVVSGNTVWNKTTNTGYNNQIFGIGRDNASRLNQVQSQSYALDETAGGLLTVYKGNLNALNDNNSSALTDKSFVMLGSNGATGNTSYDVTGLVFSGGATINSKVNYINNTKYKAQVMNNGVGGAGQSQTINLKAFTNTMTEARYVLVSSDAGFPASSTRIYPVVNGVATGVVVTDQDYVTTAGLNRTPGGVTTAYTWMTWLTPETYSNGTWTNMITTTGTIGNFSRTQSPLTSTTAAAKVTGYNYQESVKFAAAKYGVAPNQMESSGTFNIGTNEAFSIFIVAKKGTSSNGNQDYMLAYGNTGTYSAYGLWWESANTTAHLGWAPGTDRTLGNAPSGIITVDNPNSSAGIKWYTNGTGPSTVATTNSSNTYPLRIGSCRWDADGERGLNGEIQEVIILKRTGTGSAMTAADINKIHSYLAVKYGVTLSSNYINSQGDTIWNRAAGGALYNYNIFGIGRDDVSGLYQKQSKSNNNQTFAIFVTGSTLAALNRQNTGTLDDGQFVMIGSDGGKPVQTLNDIASGTVYANRQVTSSEGFNCQSAIYKAQVSGADTMLVNMQAPGSNFLYVLVSSDTTFKPENTNIYAIGRDRIATKVLLDNVNNTYIKFIGYSPGPGGVSPGLKLWLRADDDATVTIENSSISTDKKLANYPGIYPDNNPFKDPENVPTVSVWSDFLHGIDYSYSAGTAEDAHRIPVMKHSSPEMNYYPGVCFWGSGSTSYGSYLSNTGGIFQDANTTNPHTTIFVTNNYFPTTNPPWVYFLMFGSATGNGSYDGPGYGIQPNGSNLVGRLRTSGYDMAATKNLFKSGTTSILDYMITPVNTTNGNVFFRFNGVEDKSSTNSGYTFAWGNFGMNKGSQLGKGYSYDRSILGLVSEVIIYDHQVDGTDLRNVESYLAFKYGITLYPSNTASNHFDYSFSTNDVIWKGDTASGKYVDFYNNIGAVIRDDAARLYNRQAHSTNVGSLLHVGVAGTQMSFDGNTADLGELNNLEAVVFGNDSLTGTTTNTSACGDFTDRFKRKWLIEKVADRPIALLIGAQDNSRLTIGNDANTTVYYNLLNKSNDFYLIVAASPDSINLGNYRAVVPMTYINGEFQCNYTFSDAETYITFGYKANNSGCAGDENATFTGSKTFKWTQWAASNRTANTAGITLTQPALDLGNNITVATKVVYGTNVKPEGVGYPRSDGSPVAGSLYLQRSGGQITQDVAVTVDFSYPVIPEFSISALDGYSSSYEEVEIIGSCAGVDYYPTLSYASTEKASSYKIKGNIATVTKAVNILSGSNKNGRVNIKFKGGVTSITIKYRIKSKATSLKRHVSISPITLRQVPPPPPINADGLSFVKQVKDLDITTCEPAEYSFYIQNTNCDSIIVNFSDTLPEYMTWDTTSIGLDAVSSELNPALNIESIPAAAGRGEVLNITGLVVPGSTTLMITATALLDEDAPSGKYDNQATVTYERIVNNNPEIHTLPSVDRETLEPFTSFDATAQQQQKAVTVTPVYSQKAYSEKDEIEVTYTINNPNTDLTDMFLAITFNSGFTYVANSFNVTMGDETIVNEIPPVLTDSIYALTMAGSADGIDGFTLPAGTMIITFKLKAPVKSSLEFVLDDIGNPTKEIMPLEIAYGFSSTMEDPCALISIQALEGSKLIPYATSRTHIITNQNVTGKIVKK